MAVYFFNVHCDKLCTVCAHVRCLCVFYVEWDLTDSALWLCVCVWNSYLILTCRVVVIGKSWLKAQYLWYSCLCFCSQYIYACSPAKICSPYAELHSAKEENFVSTSSFVAEVEKIYKLDFRRNGDLLHKIRPKVKLKYEQTFNETMFIVHLTNLLHPGPPQISCCEV